MDDDLEDIWRDVRGPKARFPKTFFGARSVSDGTCHVKVLIKGRRPAPMPMYLDVANYSPTGFEWGYEGSGPTQLALALLLEVLGTGRDALERALRLCDAFKRKVVAKLPHERWRLEGVEIEHFVRAIENDLDAPSPNVR